MAGKIYFTLLILGIIIDFIFLIFYNFDNAVYGTYFLGIIAITIAVNIQINIIKLSNLSKQINPEMSAKILNEKEKEIIKKNKKLLRYFYLALILFAISALLIFN